VVNAVPVEELVQVVLVQGVLVVVDPLDVKTLTAVSLAIEAGVDIPAHHLEDTATAIRPS